MCLKKMEILIDSKWQWANNNNNVTIFNDMIYCLPGSSHNRPPPLHFEYQEEPGDPDEVAHF